jgi:N-acetylglucosaminyldiphosphoundecaprenol N-acetyl-beta-D-mannosaminyltransferase
MTDLRTDKALPELTSYNIAGVRVDDLTRDLALRYIECFMTGQTLHRMVTPNADFVIHASEDESFRTILNTASLCIPDGMGIMRGAQMLGVKLKENVTGRLLVRPLCELAARRGWKVYILASAPGIAPIAAAQLMRDYPGLQIVGARGPSFQFVNDPAEIEDVLSEMNRVKPDLLFLGIGAPKSERWIYDYRDRIPAKAAIGVGYAFDIIAGKIAECPAWMTRIGMEWFYRTLREPRRLWKRYFVRDPRFFYMVIKQRFSGSTVRWQAGSNVE